MIFRTYQCQACGDVFEVQCESNDGDPPCPYCEKVLEWRPGMFAIGTNKGRAVDLAQKIVEEDYGLTNMNDNNREGDVAAKMPSRQTAADVDLAMQVQSEIAQQTGVAMTEQQKQQAAGFWGGSAGQAPVSLPPAQALAVGRQAAREASAMGVNPMELLHKAGKSGNLPTGMRVIARG